MHIDGPRIKFLLAQQCCRQYELAQAVGITEARLSRALSGRAKLPPEIVDCIAKLLCVPVEYIKQTEEAVQ